MLRKIRLAAGFKAKKSETGMKRMMVCRSTMKLRHNTRRMWMEYGTLTCLMMRALSRNALPLSVMVVEMNPQRMKPSERKGR